MDSFKQKNNISDITYSVSNASLKNVYYKIANTFINLNINNLSSSLLELFKLKFNDFYINQDKYKKAYYNKNNNQLSFDSDSSSQLIHIKFKQNQDYEIEVKNELSTIVNNEYNYNLFYIINKNPSIKSGFILIDNKNNVMTHSITVEEVN